MLNNGRRIRLGGMVEAGSVKKLEGCQDLIHRDRHLERRRRSATPACCLTWFREGQGVVTEGVLQPDGSLLADTVLAKHDENYMPKEIADSLKERGVKLGAGAGQ